MLKERYSSNDDFTPSAIQKVLLELKEAYFIKWNELAKKSGIDNSTLSAVRNGTRRFPADIAKKIASGLDIDVSYIYESLAKNMIAEEKLQLFKQYHNHIRAGKDHTTFIQGNIQSLQSEDMYIVITSKTPSEFLSSEAELVRDLKEAIYKNVKVFYIFPSTEIEVLSKKQDNIVNKIKNPNVYLWTDIIDIELRFKIWKNQLLLENKDMADKLNDNLIGLSVDFFEHGFLFAPNIKFTLIKRKNNNEENKQYTQQVWVEILDSASGETVNVRAGENTSTILTDFLEKYTSKN